VPADGATMGEIVMRGNIVMKGYLKNPLATEEAFAGGWFHSGDLGVMHPDGYIELKDRSKDIIISGGENISTIEVEDVLYRHPAVLEAAVVARPDPVWGETPCAFVTIKPGSATTAEEIIAFCREHLAHFRALIAHRAVIHNIGTSVRAKPDIGRAVEPVHVLEDKCLRHARWVAGKVLDLERERSVWELVEVDQLDLMADLRGGIGGVRR